MILPLAFRVGGIGSFYSSDFVQESKPFDFVKLYISANLFESLNDNVFPSVVLFNIYDNILNLNGNQKRRKTSILKKSKINKFVLVRYRNYIKIQIL